MKNGSISRHLMSLYLGTHFRRHGPSKSVMRQPASSRLAYFLYLELHLYQSRRPCIDLWLINNPLSQLPFYSPVLSHIFSFVIQTHRFEKGPFFHQSFRHDRIYISASTMAFGKSLELDSASKWPRKSIASHCPLAMGGEWNL